MELRLPLIVSVSAPFFNCIQQIPQLVKSYQTKSLDDFSLTSIVLLCTTNCLWLLHGLFIGDWPLIVSGAINLSINLILLVLYLLFRKRKHSSKSL